MRLAQQTTPGQRRGLARPTYTLLAVHAHPDDESSGTGGLLRLAADQGHTTVLVTCTNGDLGDVKDPRLRLNPRERPADRQQLATVRHAELHRAAAILRVTHLYTLGYHDSGMDGWETNTAPHVFAQARLDEVVGQLVPIIRQHRPHVVVTYDEQGGYGHPDHIMTHRATLAALTAAADATRYLEAGPPWQAQKIYYTAWARSDALRTFKIMHLLRQKTCLRDPDFDPQSLGCPDELITTRVNVRPALRAKWQALFTHRSQMHQYDFFWWFVRLTGPWLYRYESFRCVTSPTPLAGPEADIFAGL
ncbi:MAG: GlcNAc-PI de-N-acetylase [Candidatus Tectomicrobia bacterium]|uniref:GlcNAc-PI de-N-acetylase n=1 Tax=Tectimicrobiota bacterium TaxID=2528274 RepID=A0A937W2A7_UNCTE|nr:GlcNAc-PI de-N-acetylase [Candidatus Tectomicrobia bacterium]